MSESLWFNYKTGKWEPRKIVDGDEFWTRHVYYTESPYQRWCKKVLYHDDDLMYTIEHQLASMSEYPDAEQIIQRIKQNLEHNED